MPEIKAKVKPHFISFTEAFKLRELLKDKLHTYDDETCEYREQDMTDITVAELCTSMWEVPIRRAHVSRVREEFYGKLRKNRKAPTLADVMEILREYGKRLDDLELTMAPPSDVGKRLDAIEDKLGIGGF